MLEHAVIKTSNLEHPWWERYETLSYQLSTRSGDEAEFEAMTRICNDNQVRIYVDVQINHMAAEDLQSMLRLYDATVPEGNEQSPANEQENPIDVMQQNEDFIVTSSLSNDQLNLTNFQYELVPYTAEDFHLNCIAETALGENVASGDALTTHQIRNCHLYQHPDLDHSRANVKHNIVEMLNRFIDWGVAGFYLDSGKYMWPHDLKVSDKNIKIKVKRICYLELKRNCKKLQGNLHLDDSSALKEY